MRTILAKLVPLALLAAPALGAEVLETPSFALTLPKGWVRDLRTKPVSARGPRGELLQVSSAKLQGTGTPEEAQRLRAEMEQNVVRAMERAASDPALKTVEPLRKASSSTTPVVHEMLSQAADKSWFGQFGVVGPNTVVLVTVEAPSDARSSVALVKQSVLAIKWSQ